MQYHYVHTNLIQQVKKLNYAHENDEFFLQIWR